MLRTHSPTADAERFYDHAFAEQEADRAAQEEAARELEEAQRLAPAIVLQDFQKLKKPGDWYTPNLIAGSYDTPDEILWEAIQEDDDCRDRCAELMLSQAALDLQQALAKWRGKKLSLAVMHDRVKARH